MLKIELPVYILCDTLTVIVRHVFLNANYVPLCSNVTINATKFQLYHEQVFTNHYQIVIMASVREKSETNTFIW